jgi:hypothetical protein
MHQITKDSSRYFELASCYCREELCVLPLVADKVLSWFVSQPASVLGRFAYMG